MGDNWENLGTKKCEFCINWVRKGESATGRCRANPPTLDGWPVTFENDWCGAIKLNPERFMPTKLVTESTHGCAPELSWADVANKTVAGALIHNANQMSKKKDVSRELIDLGTPDIAINVPRSDTKTLYGCDFGPGGVFCHITGKKLKNGTMVIYAVEYGKAED